MYILKNKKLESVCILEIDYRFLIIQIQKTEIIKVSKEVTAGAWCKPIFAINLEFKLCRKKMPMISHTEDFGNGYKFEGALKNVLCIFLAVDN